MTTTTKPTATKTAGISPEEVTILATLLTGDETVRLWARRMGISSSVVDHPRLQELYDALLQASPVHEVPRHLAVIERALPDHCAPHRTLFTAAMYYSGMPGFEGRLVAFQRAARRRLEKWAPEVLRHIAKRIEEGKAGKEVLHGAELLAFAAWTPQHTGPWVWNPGEEVTQ